MWRAQCHAAHERPSRVRAHSASAPRCAYRACRARVRYELTVFTPRPRFRAMGGGLSGSEQPQNLIFGMGQRRHVGSRSPSPSSWAGHRPSRGPDSGVRETVAGASSRARNTPADRGRSFAFFWWMTTGRAPRQLSAL